MTLPTRARPISSTGKWQSLLRCSMPTKGARGFFEAPDLSALAEAMAMD
jgi:hypothetical protein